MKKKIVIVEYVSTGVNLVYDVLSRGYEPVLLDCPYVATEEELRPVVALRDQIRASFPKGIIHIEENTNYSEVLEQVRKLDPILVIAGSEAGVSYATRLADDLHLPGNPAKNLSAMTEKDAMHQTLKEHGVRYIRGKVVESKEEAISYYHELGVDHVVVKRVRGAATQGVHLCSGMDEMIRAVEKELSSCVKNSEKEVGLLIQEQIIGTEYIVNTVSCQGRHRVTSLWVYDKVKLANGTNAYNYTRAIQTLDVGHSALVNYAYDVLDAIGIQYGAVHGEFMVDEKGPVLIEVNCRPMGLGLERKFLEKAFGHHETDCALDSYLNPEKFNEDLNKPYRPIRAAAVKTIILPKDTIAESTPALPLCTRLQSYYHGLFNRVGRELVISRTKDLDTIGGKIFMLHEEEQVILDECSLLHTIEMKYPDLMFQSLAQYTPTAKACRDIPRLLQAMGPGSSTLIYSDRDMTVEGATVIGEKELRSAYDSYEQGILDLSMPSTFSDLEIVIQQIYQFADKIREGGRIIIPASTYCNLPYGMEGMEILLRISGFRIECPRAGLKDVLIASITKRSV